MVGLTRYTKFDKARISNIVWTITNRYGKEVSLFILESDYFDYSLLYSSIILGSIYNTLDISMIHDFLLKLRASINKSKEIEYLLFICIEETVIPKNILIEENISNIRKKNYNSVIQKIERTTKSEKVYNIFRRAYMYKKLGKNLVFPPAIKMIISDVEDFKDVTNSREFVEKFKNLIEKYFQIELAKLEDENNDKSEKLEKNLKLDREILAKYFSNYITKNYMPNETIVDENFKNKSPIQIDEEEDREIVKFKKIENYYGKSLYQLKQIHELEREYATGIHKNYKIFFTEGKIDTIDDDYRRKTLNKEVFANRETYNKNKNLYDKHIEELVRVIRQNISSEEYTLNKSYGGIIDARNIYRAEKLNDNKIFYRKRYKNIKKLKIDIVLDSSASLLKKQSLIAVQSYMILSALERLGIETSLKTYNNFMDYTIIKILKNYQETDISRAFDYYSSGGNRDGLAIKILGLMEKIEMNESRLMIVFTDAKPFDVQVTNKIGRKERRPYKAEAAIRDTANVVRKLRKRDLNIVGVYSGDMEDMTDVKRIYGNDFIYVDDIKNFSSKVGRVISNHIKKIN